MKKILFIVLSFLLLNCTSDETDEANSNLPILTTNMVTNILSTSAICGGNISNNGGTNIVSRGICWDTNMNPTINSNFSISGFGTGEYSIEIPDLENDTEYYVRAFATNSLGTSYGNELNFTTLKNITYDVLLFEFTPDTGNNTSRLHYEIKFDNPNNISINGFYKVTLDIDGVISSNIANNLSPCYEITANSSCTLSFDEEESFDIGMINSINLISVEYNFEI